MLLHIDSDQFESIRSQGYNLGTFHSSTSQLADNEYHLTREGFCVPCNAVILLGVPDYIRTPAELETYKAEKL